MDATDFLNLQEDFAGAPVPLEALQREVPWKMPTDIDNNNNNNNNNNDDDFDDGIISKSQDLAWAHARVCMDTVLARTGRVVCII